MKWVNLFFRDQKYFAEIQVNNGCLEYFCLCIHFSFKYFMFENIKQNLFLSFSFKGFN